MDTRLILPLIGALTLSACAHTQAPQADSERAAPDPDLAFIQAACGGCHAVEPLGLSPNPEAPSFEAIANRTGLDQSSLAAWLGDAHNYPEVMDFDLEEHQVDAIAAYMVTLQSADYEPDI